MGRSTPGPAVAWRPKPQERSASRWVCSSSAAEESMATWAVRSHEPSGTGATWPPSGVAGEGAPARPVCGDMTVVDGEGAAVAQNDRRARTTRDPGPARSRDPLTGWPAGQWASAQLRPPGPTSGSPSRSDPWTRRRAPAAASHRVVDLGDLARDDVEPLVGDDERVSSVRPARPGARRRRGSGPGDRVVQVARPVHDIEPGERHTCVEAAPGGEQLAAAGPDVDDGLGTSAPAMSVSSASGQHHPVGG